VDGGGATAGAILLLFARPGRKPGASPLLFGKYLMDHCAFIGLEDISDGLPSYREEVVPVLAVMVTKSYRIAF